jgi:crossover junction endodeoxyribonuclease RuvC
VSSAGRRSAAAVAFAGASSPGAARPVRILGIDPGSRVTGYGVVETLGSRNTCIVYGRIHCGDGPLPQRLLQILGEIDVVIQEYAPHEAAVEEVFVKMNVASALVLGQARGAAICALGRAGLPVSEYAPARVKSAIVGNGRADKQQIQHMVKVLLDLSDAPPADAADALAIALCHAHLRNTPIPMRTATARRRSSRRWL